MRKTIVAVACSAIVLAGCGKPPPTSGGGVIFESSKPKSHPQVGSGTLDFKAPKLGGGQVVGSEFANKDVAIWFWAPW